MIESKEELIKRVTEILSKKSFTPKAKDNLMRSIIFAYEFYTPPKYIKATRNEYIMEYLSVLENMSDYVVIELSEINEPNEAAARFRKSIQKSDAKRGNLELVDNQYVPAQDGSYYCSVKGFAWNKERAMFSLNENNFIEEIATIHHEMTHLQEGTYPFPLDAFIPFSFEVRKMLYEGRATTRESYIHATTGEFLQGETLEDGTFIYQVDSEHSYPLYGKIYQMLQLIFTDEDLEKLSKNNDAKKNLIDELKEKYPNVPVEEIFAHIIYILSCSTKENRETLASSIHHYARFHAREVEWAANGIRSEQNCIEAYQQSLKLAQDNEKIIMQVLETPELLQAEYEQAVASAKADIEAMYKEGSYTEEEYKSELARFEQEGTLEYYREVKQQELGNNRALQETEKKSMERSREKIEELKQELSKLESNQFPMILERVCLKNPSLDTSFDYLERTALALIQEERKQIQETDPEYQILLDKIRVLLLLKERTVVIGNQKEKASRVS